MEATLDNSVVIEALRKLRRHYCDIYDTACAWINGHPENKDTEEYKLIQTLVRCADGGIWRCNMNLRLLGEQE